MIDLIEFAGEKYPAFQAEGFAAQWIMPYAKHYCKGKGYDIGCNRLEWALEGATPIDLDFNDQYNANCLPSGEVDYIFSSHCLEHVEHWVKVLDYWMSKVKSGGIIFLYLPHRKQRYWQPQNNMKHLHSFDQDIITYYFKDRGCKNVITHEGYDLNHSFTVIAEMP
jgi:trans-aconitate methyltransferase